VGLAVIGLAAGLGTIVAVVGSSALAARHRARARAIADVGRRYALGDLSRPGPDYGDDDLGTAARALDAAVREQGRRVDTLSRDRARMEAILGSMVEGVLVVDETGKLQVVNEAARRMLRVESNAAGRPYVEAIRHPGIAEQFDLVLINPPYVAEDAELGPGVAEFEPAEALFAGGEGLDEYRRLAPDIGRLLVPGGLAAVEIGHDQADAVRQLLEAHGLHPRLACDLAGRPRAMLI